VATWRCKDAVGGRGGKHLGSRHSRFTPRELVGRRRGFEATDALNVDPPHEVPDKTDDDSAITPVIAEKYCVSLSLIAAYN
jgi:hypothetical protein